MKRILGKALLFALLMGLGFFIAPVTVALVMDNLPRASSVARDAEKMTMHELLKSEREAIAKYNSNVAVMAISSVVGLIGGEH